MPNYKQIKSPDYQIDMISIIDNPNHIIPSDGKYLVQTYSEYKAGNTIQQNIHWLSCYGQKHFDEKKKMFYNTFSVTGQKVTHVSLMPLKHD